jgi:hypothetical protein
MMKKLFVILIGAAMLLMPFAENSQARGGRGGGRGISGGSRRGGSRGGSKKDRADQAKQDQSERGDSMLDGQLRRRSR